MLKQDEPLQLLIIFTACLICTSGNRIPDKCELITVKFCKGMPYNYTKLPNSLNHDNQDSIDKLLSHFDPLIQLGCSDSLQMFLCSLYVPFCTDIDNFILPCKDLCLDSKTKCEKHMKKYGYPWPRYLDCDQYPEKDICIPLETDYNDTGFDSTNLLYSYKDVDSKEVLVDTTFNEPIILLLSTSHQILLYDVATQDLISLHTGLSQTTSIDFHFQKQLIFWAEEGDGRIHRATLTLDVFRDERVIADTSPSNIESMTVDWITNHLFWLESYPSGLKVSELDGSNPTLIHKFSDVNKVPKFLVIDPLSGYLFWVDSEGDLYAPGACIIRFDLRSHTTFTVFNISNDDLHNMGRPKGLALDMEARKIYWADARSESIQSIGYDGKNFKMILTNPDFLGEPLALSRYKTNLFWSDRDTKSIGKTDLLNGKKPSFIETLITSPASDLKVFHQDLQPKGEPLYKVKLVIQPTTQATVSDGSNGIGVSFGNPKLILMTLFILIVLQLQLML